MPTVISVNSPQPSVMLVSKYFKVILLLDPLPTLKETSDRTFLDLGDPGGRSRTSNEGSESQNSSPSHSLADSASGGSEPSSGSHSVNSAALVLEDALKPSVALELCRNGYCDSGREESA